MRAAVSRDVGDPVHHQHRRGRKLRIAGAEHARVLVVAVDDPEQSLKIVTLARKHFPQLQLVARARDLTHWNALRDLGVTLVQRELFESSLESARTVLELMGQSPTRAQEMTRRFREHNIALADRMYPHHKDRAKMVAVAREGRAQLAEQMAKERQEHTEREARAQVYPGYGGVENAGEGGKSTNARDSDKNRL